MKIATWNVNSVRARLAVVLDFLRDRSPDVALFQEIKATEDNFPKMEFEDLGYNLVIHGQKSYNGVAILSKRPPEDITRGLPGDPSDEQARYVEALIPGEKGMVRVASIYLPNGNPVESEKFTYKLAWLERLHAHAKQLLTQEEPLVLAGDYNVIPQDDDCWDPALWAQDALGRPESRAAFRRLVNLGLTDAFRACQGAPHRYSFWDYQGGAWEKDHGIRIDHHLLSPQAADRLKSCVIDKSWRGREKASDHVPVIVELDV